jgi:hypothetical protein
MRKFILYAGMAFILSFCAVAKVEAGRWPFTIEIDSTDPCAGGAVDCTYLFTAKDSSSNKIITMARRPVALESEHDAGDHSNHGDEYRSTDWYYYDLPIYTKSQVQAGYFIDTKDNKLVLMVAYSADKEDKSGGIVSRTSADYGETWTSSIDVSSNKHPFGLAVAPNSRYIAIQANSANFKLRYLSRYTTSPNKYRWVQKDEEAAGEDHYISLDAGLSVIANDSYVVLSFIHGSGKSGTREFDISSEEWLDRSNMTSYKNHSSSTAWLCNDTGTNSGFSLAAKRKNSNGKKRIGVHPTDDLLDYSTFIEWNSRENDLPVSGMWKCPDNDNKYILAVDDQRIWGLRDDGSASLLYESNQNTSLQRRVSMFNVPAK